jgi:phospholipase C
MIRRGLFSIILLLSVVAGPFIPVKAASGPNSAQTKTPIEHIVTILQENHSFDNYFGTYPGANGLPAGVSMPVDPNNPGAGSVTPWHLGNTTLTDLSHSLATFRDQYNNGKMDSFISALNQRNQDGRLSMGYYDGRDIPYYWNLADHYVLFDQFFSSASDGSFANHMYWVAGIPPIVDHGQSLADKLANVPTIFDHLQQAGVSWKFYVQNYDPTITYRDMGSVGNRESQVIWVPLLNIDRFIDNPVLASHIVDLSQYFADLESGNLPAVSYIVPSGASEHPPSSLLSGQKFIKNVIQELMRSSAWNSSAFLLAYDDWGGWYDHVKPPQVDDYGYGLRVPALLISPYAKEGYIDNTQLDFTSILKFIEVNWGVDSLSDRDAAANNFLTAFDFTQAPRQALFTPLTRENAAVIKADPSRIIYLVYGLAFLLAVAAIAFAAFRSRNTKLRHIQRVAE